MLDNKCPYDGNGIKCCYIWGCGKSDNSQCMFTDQCKAKKGKTTSGEFFRLLFFFFFFFFGGGGGGGGGGV